MTTGIQFIHQYSALVAKLTELVSGFLIPEVSTVVDLLGEKVQELMAVTQVVVGRGEEKTASDESEASEMTSTELKRNELEGDNEGKEESSEFGESLLHCYIIVKSCFSLL